MANNNNILPIVLNDDSLVSRPATSNFENSRDCPAAKEWVGWVTLESTYHSWNILPWDSGVQASSFVLIQENMGHILEDVFWHFNSYCSHHDASLVTGGVLRSFNIKLWILIRRAHGRLPIGQPISSIWSLWTTTCNFIRRCGAFRLVENILLGADKLHSWILTAAGRPRR